MPTAIYPPEWKMRLHFTTDDMNIKDGDLIPMWIEQHGDCPNCQNELGQLFAYDVGKGQCLHWFGERQLRANLITVSCPICRGDERGAWLVKNSGLDNLSVDGKPALEIEIDPTRSLSGQNAAFKAVVASLQELPKPKTWLLLVGGYGRGKTHILCGMVNACRKSGVLAHYTTSAMMLDRIRQAYEFDKAYAAIKEYKDLPVLVLDELDRVKWTEWAGEKLFDILNARYMADKACWLASNTVPSEMKNVEPLAALLSRATVGRVVSLTGQDLRPTQQARWDERKDLQ